MCLLLSHVQLFATRWTVALLCPWGFPGENIRMGCHFLLQGIFPTQGSNSSLLPWQADSLPLSQQGSLNEIIAEAKKTPGGQSSPNLI